MPEAQTLPTRRDEAWRYADIPALERLGVDALDAWQEITLAAGETRRLTMVIGSNAPELHRIRLTLGEGARAEIFASNIGGDYTRVEVEVTLAKGAHFEFGGVTIGGGEAVREFGGGRACEDGTLDGCLERLDYVAKHVEVHEIDGREKHLRVLYMPRTDSMPDDPSSGLARYAGTLDSKIDGLIYPDRRGEGYGLSRHEDSPLLDFTQIDGEPDVHFAHARGFIAKTSATALPRLKELVSLARV